MLLALKWSAAPLFISGFIRFRFYESRNQWKSRFHFIRWYIQSGFTSVLSLTPFYISHSFSPWHLPTIKCSHHQMVFVFCSIWRPPSLYTPSLHPVICARLQSISRFQGTFMSFFIQYWIVWATNWYFKNVYSFVFCSYEFFANNYSFKSNLAHSLLWLLSCPSSVHYATNKVRFTVCSRVRISGPFTDRY